MLLPQSSNGNAKAKPKIRNPKEKNLIKDNALRLRLKPHHQAHRLRERVLLMILPEKDDRGDDK